MVDWQQAPADTARTSLRLRIVHHAGHPAESYGSYRLGDLSGSGFVAALFKGVRLRDTTDAWELAGPVPCGSLEEFEKAEWPVSERGVWPQQWVAEFDPYTDSDGAGCDFAVPIGTASEHGWCDLAHTFRGVQRTYAGTQPAGVSAYAFGTVTVADDHAVELANFDNVQWRLWAFSLTSGRIE
jgi:hypothetical protein